MKLLRKAAIAILGLIFTACLFANFLAPAPYGKQFREHPNSPPSRQFLLGTDDLGRDRFSRLLYGSRVSLLLAPAAALLSILIAATIGGLGGYLGGWYEKSASGLIDLVLSLPWIFLLLTLRAILPLNVSPVFSVVLTFTLLGVLGWAPAARVVSAGARSLRDSDMCLQALASGASRRRTLVVHILPNLRPILMAQFWVTVPLFILAEANLGILGLGVSEPLPSWGNMMRELGNYAAIQGSPWIFAPVALLLLVVVCFQLVLAREEVPA